MASILRSRKGVESAPFFLIVSAVIIVFTLSIVFPGLQHWTMKINDGRALKETQKLKNAIDEIHAMGDVGTIEKIDMDLPPGYYIKVGGSELEAWREAMYDSGLATERLGALKLNTDVNTNINSGRAKGGQIFGLMTIELMYGENAATPNDFQIIVK